MARCLTSEERVGEAIIDRTGAVSARLLRTKGPAQTFSLKGGNTSHLSR